MKDNLNYLQIEDELTIFVNQRGSKKKMILQPKPIKILTMIVVPLRETYYYYLVI